MKRGILCILGVVFLSFPSPAGAKEGIVNTLHNLSLTGPGTIKALPGADPLDRICIFCHTPHNASPRTPLWNKSIKPVSYVPYTSTTMAWKPSQYSQPDGPSRLCLSCHDGTLALGALLMPVGGIATTGQIAPGRTTYLGVVLSGDHPFSFPYSGSVGNPLAGLSPTPPPDLEFYNKDVIHCTTCHDAHEDAYKSVDKDGRQTGKFLVAENRNSALCVKCHGMIEGWYDSAHQRAIYPSSVASVLPVPPKKWPTWKTVAEWGCEGCHTSHSAGGQQRLLHFREEERNCYLCHDGTATLKNIRGQFLKRSIHPVEATTGTHDPLEPPRDIATSRHVECADCHNPHMANGNTATPPYVSGKLGKVSGVTRLWTDSVPAVYEYEICFKCHADLQMRDPFKWRVVNSVNTRLEFSTSNPSYHPVIGSGMNSNVPSIPSPDEPTLKVGDVIYCTSCHSDDGEDPLRVSRGPHGSSYPPILRYQYITDDNIPESYDNYKLCYRCHNRTSILNDDSFKKTSGRGGHSGHLITARAPCSACHDPHGVAPDPISGSHTKLINFNTDIVFPVTTNPTDKPRYNDGGIFSGSCTLTCHGVVHNNRSYP